MKLEEVEVKSLIERIGPSLGYDYTEVIFPETHDNVCVAKRTAENGSTYGYDTIYIVWKDSAGKINHEKLINSMSSKDYIHIDKVSVEKDILNVEVYSGGSYGGKAWRKSYQRELTRFHL